MVKNLNKILDHWRDGKSIKVSIEKLGDLLLYKSFFKNMLKKIYTIVLKNNFSGHYLILGEEGSGKTQLAYFIFKKLLALDKRPEIEYLDLSLIQTIENLVIRVDNFYIVDNVDDLVLSDSKRLIGLIKKVYDSARGSIIVLRDESYEKLLRDLAGELEFLKKIPILARLTFSQDDLTKIVSEIIKVVEKIPKIEEEDAKIYRKYLKDFLLNRIYVGEISSIRDIVKAFTNEFEFARNVLDLGSLRSSRGGLGVILKTFFTELTHFIREINIREFLGGEYLEVKTIDVVGSIKRGERYIFSIFETRFGEISFSHNIKIFVSEMEKFDFGSIKDCASDICYIIIYKKLSDAVYNYMQKVGIVFLQRNLLAYLPHLKGAGKRIFLSKKIGLYDLIREFILDAAYIELFKKFNVALRKKGLSDDTIRKYVELLILATLNIFMDRKRVSIERVYRRFRCCILNLFNKIFEISEDKIKAIFGGFVSSLVRERTLVEVGKDLVVLRSFDDLVREVDRVSGELFFRIKFYFL